MKTRSQGKDAQNKLTSDKDTANIQQETTHSSANSDSQQATPAKASKGSVKSQKKDNFLNPNSSQKEQHQKSPVSSPQLAPDNLLKSPKVNTPTIKSPNLTSETKSPSQHSKLPQSPDPLSLDKGTSAKKKADEIKIDFGAFVQKQQVDINEYLSHFEEKQKLGVGHYSEVYKIKSKDKDSYKAIKIIKKKKIPFNEKESFLREIKILKKLDHPNILKLYEFLEDNDNYYLITEFCEGKELFDVIYENSENLTEIDIASITQQILQSLAYAHSNKIMHRDIKPENIMVQVDQSGKYLIKVVDWGVGGDFSAEDTSLNQKVGTPYYAAPEVIKKKYNEKCDIWSTGVILHTLLVSEVPFDGESTTDILLSVLRGKFDVTGEVWQKVSDEAKDLVKKMLVQDYENRISAEQALQHPWFKILLSQQKQSKQTLKLNLSRLKKFKAQSQLQRAAMSFIVGHLISEKDKETFSAAFKQLDKNGDGQLSKDEIMNGYQEVYGKHISEEEVDKIFNQIDINRSGQIDYTEFVTAVIDGSVFTEQEKLKEAFSLFDKDGDGNITYQEIESVLGVGMQIDTETWKNIVSEVDENGDGQVSFEEFKKIMESLVQQEAGTKKKQSKKKQNMMVNENQE